MQRENPYKMIHGVAPVVAHYAVKAGFSVSRLLSGRFIIGQCSLRRLHEERVSHGFAIERPAAPIDHQGDQQELNNSSERGRHSWVFDLICE